MSTPGPTFMLERRYFLDADIYRRETDRIFRRRWLQVGRAAQLPAAGSFVTVEIEGEHLILLRDREKHLRAFHNHCRHRGTRLCNEPAGQLGTHITCPYHAWSYSLDGRLQGAPHMEETPGFSKADYPLHAVACAEWDGHIFVHLDAKPAPFEQTFAPVLTKFAPWHVHELVCARTVEYDVAANWKLIVQNYSECYHCPIIHPALNEHSHYRAAKNDLTEGPFLGGPMRITRDGGGLTRTGQRCAPPLPGVKGEDLQHAYYYLIFPSFLISLQPDFVLTHRLIRKGAGRTQIVCQWFYHPEAVAAPGFDPSAAVDFWDQINREDWKLCELSQAGIQSTACSPGPYSTLESMPAAFDREYLAAMTGDSAAAPA
ncbi:MAG: aromatic ring-hydroxylating dioxygenase subunit alpha [Pedosphaera sp.]|nr:aromatic ring-hydroxylating dioxygenase subunit alpha [Pedosphaera sp.]